MVFDVKQRVTELIEPVLINEGYELADIALSRYKQNVVMRLFVYAETGVTLDGCSHLSRVVGDVIDGTDLFEHGYTLEVSSPGLDRPLTRLRDFKYRVGEMASVTFTDPKRKKITAEIAAITEDAVEFRDDDGVIVVPVAEIEKAKIIY